MERCHSNKLILTKILFTKKPKDDGFQIRRLRPETKHISDFGEFPFIGPGGLHPFLSTYI